MQLPAHPGQPLYRMAATGSHQLGQVIFAGGSENPYNFNGIGYNGEPSAPAARVFALEPRSGTWTVYAAKPLATMDHRGLLEVDGAFWTVGGMLAGQQVTAALDRFVPKTDE